MTGRPALSRPSPWPVAPPSNPAAPPVPTRPGPCACSSAAKDGISPRNRRVPASPSTIPPQGLVAAYGPPGVARACPTCPRPPWMHEPSAPPSPHQTDASTDPRCSSRSRCPATGQSFPVRVFRPTRRATTTDAPLWTPCSSPGWWTSSGRPCDAAPDTTCSTSAPSNPSSVWRPTSMPPSAVPSPASSCARWPTPSTCRSGGHSSAGWCTVRRTCPSGLATATPTPKPA